MRDERALPAYEFPRCTYYCGRWIRHGDWYPDRVTRLWQKDKAVWQGIDPHARLKVQGPVGRLHSDLLHFSNESVDRQIAKIAPYSDYFVRHCLAEGRRVTRTIPAGRIGNEQPIVSVTEEWRSPELQVLVMTRTADPRTGESVYKPQNIVNLISNNWFIITLGIGITFIMITGNFDMSVGGNIALTGEIDLQGRDEFTIAIALGRSCQSTVTKLMQSMAEPADVHREAYVRQWQRTLVDPTYDFSRHTSDGGHLYRLSRCILLAHEPG